MFPILISPIKYIMISHILMYDLLAVNEYVRIYIGTYPLWKTPDETWSVSTGRRIDVQTQHRDPGQTVPGCPARRT